MTQGRNYGHSRTRLKVEGQPQRVEVGADEHVTVFNNGSSDLDVAYEQTAQPWMTLTAGSSYPFDRDVWLSSRGRSRVRLHYRPGTEAQEIIDRVRERLGRAA